MDLAELTTMVAQSLGGFILAGLKHDQANLMADALTALGSAFLDKPDDDERPHRAH